MTSSEISFSHLLQQSCQFFRTSLNNDADAPYRRANQTNPASAGISANFEGNKLRQD
jgi:hypothetical protein